MSAKSRDIGATTYLDVILEQEPVATHRVVTNKTVRSSELQPGDVLVVLKERLVAGDPSKGRRREKTEPL